MTRARSGKTVLRRRKRLRKLTKGFRLSRHNESFDYDGTPANILENVYVTNQPWGTGSQQFSEEFQVQGKSLNHRLDWILGAYYAHQEETNENDNVILPPLITNAIHSVSKTDSKAIFALQSRSDDAAKSLCTMSWSAPCDAMVKNAPPNSP